MVGITKDEVIQSIHGLLQSEEHEYFSRPCAATVANAVTIVRAMPEHLLENFGQVDCDHFAIIELQWCIEPCIIEPFLRVGAKSFTFIADCLPFRDISQAPITEEYLKTMFDCIDAVQNSIRRKPLCTTHKD